ncbi:hypothetical protein AciPR4_2679 [Terriglobus saanensis SP1PR4]|uniref:Uncharacterized protein n=1 Tax=Terriglobus saanensis (strain ATCC BAA-1853 / DSM 23119 / SP1PR4) TaxID=401053 RepID=E8V1W6_TERSS|nr:hypothetical protein AciPR4_2679 [Terriglobus saanensis SP1PR4]
MRFRESMLPFVALCNFDEEHPKTMTNRYNFTTFRYSRRLFDALA